jgi:hypothetical protein
MKEQGVKNSSVEKRTPAVAADGKIDDEGRL